MKSGSMSAKVILASALVMGLATVAIPQAQAQTFKVVHNFTNGSDGGGPLNGLTMDGSGNLYGTTNTGGTSNYGVVFKISKSGAETVLHSFTGETDGVNPQGLLLWDKSGYIYGTSTAGGAS